MPGKPSIKELQKLLARYKDGTATKEEADFVEQYYQYFEDQADFSASLSESEKTAIEDENWERLTARIEQPSSAIPSQRVHFLRKWGWAVAASLILTFGVGGYFFLTHKDKPENSTQATVTNDVKAPESNKAMITLAGGRTVSLDSVSKGLLAEQGNVKLVKLADGQIAYQSATGEAVKEIQYNTLSNPRGSKVIDMQLADGSHVWLNAGSSVTYPVAFAGNERKVSITGEAYFEIAHDAAKPFYVSKGETQIQVLGTHFNVNAYDDEKDIKVTLLEGAVRVSNGNSEGLLKPGEQALVATGVKVVNNVDIDAVMAWKNGLFAFSGSDIKDVMRQLARWYDLEVSYAGDIPARRFKGKISKDLSLSQVLNGLTATRIHFKIEGSNKITVLPE